MGKAFRKYIVPLGILAALAATAQADSFTDVPGDGTSAWDSAATWDQASIPTSSADVIIIDSSTVTVGDNDFTGGTVSVNTGGTLSFSSGASVSNALNLSLNGGTLSASGTTFGSTGINVLSVSGISTVDTRDDGAIQIGNEGSNQGKITGSGTLVKQGSNPLRIRTNSADSGGSDFSGTYIIEDGSISFYHSNQYKNATIILKNDVEMLLLNTHVGSTPRATGGLSGHGRLLFNVTGGTNDWNVFSGQKVAPGFGAGAVGTIGLAGTTGNHELRLWSDANGRGTLEFDIIGANPADADKINWVDGNSTVTTRANVDFEDGKLSLKVFTPTADLGGPGGAALSWTIIEAEIFGPDTQTPGQFEFAEIELLNALGGALDSGWKKPDGTPGLAVLYDYTLDNASVKVSGYFTAIPEPASLGVVLIGLGALLRRRRR